MQIVVRQNDKRFWLQKVTYLGMMQTYVWYKPMYDINLGMIQTYVWYKSKYNINLGMTQT